MARGTTEAEFVTQVLETEGPVLVRFEAEWSASCRQLFPIMGQLASDFAHRLPVVTVDVDEQPEIAEAYAIPGIPTLVLFRNGQRVAEKCGPLPKERLSHWLEQALAPDGDAPHPQRGPRQRPLTSTGDKRATTT
jgi:thioredoxin 1